MLVLVAVDEDCVVVLTVSFANGATGSLVLSLAELEPVPVKTIDHSVLREVGVVVGTCEVPFS